MLNRLLCALLVCLLALPVYAGQIVPVSHSAVNVTTSSTSVATNINSLLILVNDSDTVIYCNLAGGAAVLNSGVRLNADGGALFMDVVVPAAGVNCIHGGTGNKVMLVSKH